MDVRYWDSRFLGHAAHKDLLEHFNSALEGIDLSKIIQVSMDGPSVNWRFYNEVVKQRQEMELHQLINIGSCGLHIIHDAFKTGVEKTEWCIKNALKGSFQILHDTPARSDCSSIPGSDIFPLFFCATRWVEDKPVSDRLLKIWPNIVKLVNFWLTLPKSKQPKSKSFEAVKSAVEDNLTIVKLNVFSYLASLFHPFLKKYQTEKPMIPYMYQDLVQLLHNVLQIVVKQEIIDKCTSGQSLSKIDLDSGEVFKNVFYLGFAAESEIKDLKKKGYFPILPPPTIHFEHFSPTRGWWGKNGKVPKKDRVKNTEIQNVQKNVRSCVISTLKRYLSGDYWDLWSFVMSLF